MTGEKLSRLWTRLSNNRGDVVTNTALPPEVQARLDKLERDNASLGFKLRSHERIVKGLGDQVEYDEHGNPVGFRQQEMERTAAPAPAGASPFAGLIDDPATVERYLEGLWAQKGYLTRAEAEKLADARASTYASTVMGNAKVWRNYDKLTASEKYKALSDRNSDLAKRTARILQERRYGSPMSEESQGFDEWRFREIGDLQLAADLARLEISEESKASAVSTASATEAQAASGLTAVPSAGAAVAGGGKPDFEAMKSTEEVLDALDKASPAGPPS